jgi:actin-related protein 5
MNGHTNGSMSPLHIYDAHSAPFPGPTPQAEDYETFQQTGTAIVIDNGIILMLEVADFSGSSQLRAGWASEISPRLSIENLVARYKERRAPKTYCLVGNDVLADQAARINAKGPYEGPVISNWDLMVSPPRFTLIYRRQS